MAAKQSEAVYQAFLHGQQSGLSGGDLKAFVIATVADGLMNGTVECKTKPVLGDQRASRQYAKALTNGRFKKDERITGVKYEPSTRRHAVYNPRIAKLQETLKKLKAADPRNELIPQVEAAIQVAIAQITPEAPEIMSREELSRTLLELGIPSE
jgi:hypothetical protein